MFRVFLLILLIVGAGVLALNGIKAKVKQDLAQPFASSAVSPSTLQQTKYIPATGSDTTSLFVPYWTLKDVDFTGDDYDQYLYFGIAPTKTGINTNESGYSQMKQFTAAIPQGKGKLLVLRMLESDTNSAILRSTSQQKNVIGETIRTAKEQGFDGIVLDLELSAIPFDSLIVQIRDFNTAFYTQTKASGLSYGIAIYGDTFYRLRPFDVKAIAQKTDTIYIMAYDFHKSRGNPGPNFPLEGKDTYGYDMATMSDDFLRNAPPEKIIVVFGLFGYDWKVDAKGSATEHGEALAYNELANKFLRGCEFKNCSITRDAVSGETKITYTDKNNGKHTVWFEDNESVEEKQAYLRNKGINNFSFWANGYF